jgi:hypothetical protein
MGHARQQTIPPVQQERDLADRALDTLRALDLTALIAEAEPFAKHPNKTPQPDLKVTLGRKAKKATYLAEVRRTLRPATLGPLLLRLREWKQPTLLLTDYVTPAMAQMLREANIAFADTVGNAYVEMEGAYLYVIGNVPKQPPRAEKINRAFQPAGLRIVFALICQPELIELPTRELAARLQVANGTVGRVLEDLAHLGFVTTIGRRNRRLHNVRDLLERWAMMYPAQLRPTLIRRRLNAEVTEWWKQEEFENGVALGGEPAAARLTKYLKPGTVTLYVRPEPKPLNELIVRHHLRTDANGNVEVLEAFWPQEIPTDEAGLVPTPLIYADLLATGDARCIETAKLLYDEYLARRLAKT